MRAGASWSSASSSRLAPSASSASSSRAGSTSNGFASAASMPRKGAEADASLAPNSCRSRRRAATRCARRSRGWERAERRAESRRWLDDRLGIPGSPRDGRGHVANPRLLKAKFPCKPRRISSPRRPHTSWQRRCSNRHHGRAMCARVPKRSSAYEEDDCPARPRRPGAGPDRVRADRHAGLRRRRDWRRPHSART